MMQRIAHAKINLSLHVTGQREDGYHLLDSLVAFTHFGDTVTVFKNENPLSLVWLKIEGPFAKGLDEGANNLVNRAALALAYRIMEKGEKPEPVKIILEKNLPIASGIGGGSADAAATLLALADFWGYDQPLDDLALALGADVPMCLHSKPLRATNIGEVIEPLDISDPFHVVLVNPGVEVSTPSIFSRLQEKSNPPMPEHAIRQMDLASMRNDLQEPAITLEPAIADVLAALENTDCKIARMSGSGATCFAIYDTLQLASEAAEKILKARPDWWCMASSTTVSQAERITRRSHVQN